MSVTVRSAASSDAALLHSLAAATFGLACPPGTPQSAIDDFVAQQLSEARFAEYLADAHRTLLIAEADAVREATGTLVGPYGALVLAAMRAQAIADTASSNLDELVRSGVSAVLGPAPTPSVKKLIPMPMYSPRAPWCRACWRASRAT